MPPLRRFGAAMDGGINFGKNNGGSSGEGGFHFSATKTNSRSGFMIYHFCTATNQVPHNSQRHCGYVLSLARYKQGMYEKNSVASLGDC